MTENRISTVRVGVIRATSIAALLVVVAGCSSKLHSSEEQSDSMPNIIVQTRSIDIDMPDSATVLLVTYSYLGNVIDTVVKGWLPEGRSSFALDPGRYPQTGVYFYKLTSDRFNATRKFVYMR
ncbi:MAG TPA: hypothetical protein VJ983_06230 [candidate division Zixibacteria bacterium]|nr:hypothetical protein [candidate division Zixibacteria bacterium]